MNPLTGACSRTEKMLKDIDIPKVEDVAVAIVPEVNKLGEEMWNVYLVNLKDTLIEGVLVSSRGYGSLNGESKRTATFRHFLDVLDGRSFKKIEEIVPEVFGLNNEFWVSFYLNKKMYDKKYIFLPETISEEHFSTIPVLEKKGVLIK